MSLDPEPQDYTEQVKRLMRVLAYGAPIVTFAACLFREVTAPSMPVLVGSTVQVVFSLVVSQFLMCRVGGREAMLPRLRVPAGEPVSIRNGNDLLALALALASPALAIYLWFLR
jgi:hypothetical protein